MTTALPRRIPDDPALPGLAHLFDPAGARALAAALAEQVTGTPVAADTGEVVYVKYKPTKVCVAQWAFPVSSGQSILVSAKLFSGRQGADLISHPRFRSAAETVRSRAGWAAEPHRYLDDRRLLLQLFPMDVKLPALPLAASGSWAAGVFASALGLSPKALCITDITPVAYNPWNRCVFRYTVEEGSRRRRYFAKLFRDDRGGRMYPVLQLLSATLSASGAPWAVPALVAFVPEARMLVLEALEGAGVARSLLKQAVHDRPARGFLEDVFGRAAGALPQFQQLAVEGLSVMTPQALLQSLERKAKGVSHVAPALAQSIQAELAGLELEAARLPSEAMVLAHGAFRHTHLLLCDEKLGLVDLDNLRVAGASADAGDFLAYLDRTTLHQPALKPIIQELEEAFIAGLRRHYMEPRWLAWYRAAAHAKWSIRSVHSLSLKGEWAAEEQVALKAEARSC